jgi:predicted nucleic-acid-binding protein
MWAVDTNVLVRTLTGDDPVQSPAAEAFFRAHAPVWVSHAVLMETVWVLDSVYGCGKRQLAEALARIIDNKVLALEEPAAVRAALALYRSRSKVNFEDCMILEIARKAGHHPLATFDKALGKCAGSHLLGRNA